jgi:hypothetical protein
MTDLGRLKILNSRHIEETTQRLGYLSPPLSLHNIDCTVMSSLVVFNRVYRLEIQSVLLVFSTQLCKLLPL